MTQSHPVRMSIRVISLQRSKKRREAFEAHVEASRTTLPWRYFSAHTQIAPELIYKVRDAMIAKGRGLYPAELGCYSSHYTLWREFLESNDDQILVLEDDVVIDWSFVEILNSCHLSQLGIHYLKLFNKNATPFRVVSDRFHQRELIDCRGFAHGTQAYIVTRRGAERFIAWCRTVRRPIDDELDRSWSHGVPNVAVFPFPAFEKQGPSAIGGLRYEHHSLPSIYRALRLQLRLTEKLLRWRQRCTGFGYQSGMLTDITKK